MEQSLAPLPSAPSPTQEPMGPLRRPGVVTAAGVVLIVTGALVGLFGLLAALVGSQWESFIQNPQVVDQVGVLSATFGRLLTVIGLILAAFGALDLVSGVYVLMARGWARIAGIVLALIGGLFWLLSMIGVTARSAPVLLVLLGSSAFVIWALAANGAYFDWRSRGANG